MPHIVCHRSRQVALGVFEYCGFEADAEKLCPIHRQAITIPPTNQALSKVTVHAEGAIVGMGYRRSLYVVLVGVFLVAGCGKSEPASSTSAAPSAAPSDAAKPAAAAPANGAKPGYATGHVLGQEGKPITAQGAKISLAIYGISSKSGEKVSYNPKINADGSYEQKLVDGTYSFGGARIDVPFNGKHYVFDLYPVGEDDRSDRESEKGIVQNYTWKLTGLRPGEDADESNFTKWYGGSVRMQFSFYREDTKKSVAKPPDGTKCVFTLKPEGKLIDGSEGKTLTFTRDFDPLLSGLKNGNMPDIPVGVYTVSGEEVLPDATKKPLLIQQAYAKFGDSTRV
jgi:hypothetical protein